MKRAALIILIAYASACGIAHAQNVTNNPAIQTDLKLAQTYWAIEQPDLKAPCKPEHVQQATMTTGEGPNNTPIPANQAWAETILGSCTINLSPNAWADAQNPNTNAQYQTCILIAHEYGHTLGLPDTTTIPMMSLNWNRRDDPLCAQHVFGWAGTPLGDREWLAWHHQARKHYKGITIPVKQTATPTSQTNPTQPAQTIVPSQPIPLTAPPIAPTFNTTENPVPPQGIFETCDIATQLSTCETRLAQIETTGFQIVVTSIPDGTPTQNAAYLATLAADHLQAIWEVSDPGWWGYDPSGNDMLSHAPEVTANCACTTNAGLLTYITSTFGPGSWGWYIADDSEFGPVSSAEFATQTAGLRTFVAALQALSPNTQTLLSDYGDSSMSELSGAAGIATITAHELYPVRSYLNGDPGADNATNSVAATALGANGFILQAFDWGECSTDSSASGSDPNIDAYPTAAQLLAMRNAVLPTNPQILLWYDWTETAGWPDNNTPADCTAPSNPTSRIAALQAAITTP